MTSVNVRYSIPQVLALRDKLATSLEFDLHSDGTPEFVNAVVEQWSKLLPRQIPLETLRESLWHWCNEELTAELVKSTAWRLAGNLRRLRSGVSVSPWCRQPYDEWVPVQVLKMQPRKSRGGKRGQYVTYQVLAGLAAGMKLSAVWSHSFLSVVAQRVGFSKPWGVYPFQHPWQLVSLRMRVLIARARSLQEPEFQQVEDEIAQSLLEYNRALLRARSPAHRQCPRNYTHPCYGCHIGYNNQLCPLSSHPENWLQGLCSNCHKLSWFDQERSSSLCVDCLERKAYGY